jgi:hypothetical protein
LLPRQAAVSSAVHATQVPAAEHTGAEAGQSAAPAQARHVWVVASHTGFVPEQSASLRQPMHAPWSTSHSGVAPVQAVMFVAEQAPHAPDSWQAGMSIVAEQSTSAEQVRHRWAVGSQTGFVPLHWASPLQPTHVPVAAWQTGVAPVQAAAFVAEH